MPSNQDLCMIACRASNISERLSLAQEVSTVIALEKLPNPLVSMDLWSVDRVVGKLAVMQLQQSLFQPLSTSVPSQPQLRQLLIDYKRCERNLECLPEAFLNRLRDGHASWLNIYRSAIETLNLPMSNFQGSIWLQPEIYHQQFAVACEPFLRLIQARLQCICDDTSHNEIKSIFNESIIADVQRELLSRFQLILARAIEADIKIFRYSNDITNLSTREQYESYMSHAFADEQGYQRFFLKFPVLARWLSSITGFLVDNTIELAHRLNNDIDEISSRFFDGADFHKVSSLKLGKSDPHAHGKSVVVIEIETYQTNQELVNRKLVYKPRCIRPEAGMQKLLEILNESKTACFPTYHVLCREGYGYAEFIPVGANTVESEEVVQNFYKQLGGYLAIFHILGGSDMHFENILAANGNAFICDCETVLDAIPCGADKQATVFDSVFKTGMLAWPQVASGEENKRINLTGYGGGESYRLPFAVPRVVNRMSLDLAIEESVGLLVKVAATNRLLRDGQLVDPREHKDSISQGFNSVYHWFLNNQWQAINAVHNSFNHSSIRFVNRATQVYAHLTNSSQHAKCLSDPLEVDLVFYSLVRYPRSWDEQGQLAQLEFASLWQLDVPIFTAKAQHRDLTYNYETTLIDFLQVSPVENSIDRIGKLSVGNLELQNQYIHASLATDEADNQCFVSTSTDYAYHLGTQLCLLLQDHSCSAPWRSVEFSPTGKRLADINSSLYSGSAGICLFLAYLNSIRPEKQFRDAAERALTHAIAHRDHDMIGAFQGSAGLIYLLTHLAHLWQQPELLEQACQITTKIASSIEEDCYYDVIHGVAGIIPVLLGLAKSTSGEGISTAKQCARHLLQNAVLQHDTLSWPTRPEYAKANLTGFSHGASGIGWALITLGAHLEEPEYIMSGLSAFAYEATQFDREEKNWYDLRTSVLAKDTSRNKFAHFWCSGASGIGLSRIASWSLLGKTDEVLYQDADTALRTTLRSLNRLDNDSLCHGKAGNAEFLLRFSMLAEQPYLRMEANILATEQWRSFERTHSWTCGAGGSDVVPGLMMGLAGIGMHFLRLAYPDKVPSPLLLDAPLLF